MGGNNYDEESTYEETKWSTRPPPASKRSLHWRCFHVFDLLKHSNIKDRKACLICFAFKKHKKVTVYIVGGSTSGLLRHVQMNHRKEFEATGKKEEETSITGNFASKNKEEALCIKDVKRIFVVAETA